MCGKTIRCNLTCTICRRLRIIIEECANFEPYLESELWCWMLGLLVRLVADNQDCTESGQSLESFNSKSICCVGKMLLVGVGLRDLMKTAELAKEVKSNPRSAPGDF